MSNIKETREYKSNSFSLLLKKKEYALEIYNVLNGTDYDNPKDVEIIEVEGAFSLTVRGDAEFLIGNDLNLYERQSTKNPNMPLRFLIYITEIYREIAHNENIYGSKLIKIPNPKFVVFYNGTDSSCERIEYRLSDSFEKKGFSPELELKCLCININPGYNNEIREKSIALSGYTKYVEKVRENCKTMEIQQAVKSAVDECISEGVLKETSYEKSSIN